MKNDWKKTEKGLYLPKSKPERVVVPPMNFFTLSGTGNPNLPFFAEYIGVLYSLAYAVKMSPKKGIEPPGYTEYAVYPLEGIWDLQEAARPASHERIDKDALVFTLMIRQPDFVTPEYARETIERIQKTKPHELLGQVRFETLTEGPCVQMLHLGPYDAEPESFRIMEAFAQEQGLARASKIHREIYLSDARKTPPEKLKTVLRFQVAW